MPLVLNLWKKNKKIKKITKNHKNYTPMTTTYSLSDVTDITFSKSCLQGPCLHGVKITVTGREEPIVVHAMIGNDIARMLRVKNKRTGAHFNWFLTEPGWSTSTQSKHMNKEPITIGPFVFTYPEGYKPKKMKEIKLPPVRPRKLTANDEPSEKGRQHCLKHGIHTGLVSFNEAKAMVSMLYI